MIETLAQPEALDCYGRCCGCGCGAGTTMPGVGVPTGAAGLVAGGFAFCPGAGATGGASPKYNPGGAAWRFGGGAPS